jgi:hypothetical protein
MIDAALRESLAAFDDETLATLANPGLVRRARRDMEEGKVRLVASGAGTAEVEADGQLVSLDARGPRAADCACRSLAVCRHRIAAVIFVLAQDAGAVETSVAGGEPEADPTGILAGFDLVRLEKWAGKAGWRAALELAGTADGVDAAANAIAVAFPDIEGPVRILRGQGFDGIVSKASKARIKAYHAAAVLAALRHSGMATPEAEAAPEPAAAQDMEVDQDFLARVRSGLGEVARLGLNLAPLPLEESLFELSVSSRADSLPRLAALLRAVAAQMRLRRDRALEFDPDRMLELTATAHSLAGALALADAERRSVLAGKVRRDFAPAAPLQLVGCGGERWMTVSGARGVTAWFVEPATGRWLSTTLARGAGQDPAFRPSDAWHSQPMWQSEPLAVLAHARIELEGSRRSADDRLSAPVSARATILDRSIRPEPGWPGVVHDWDALRSDWLAKVGLGLDSTETSTACLIAPSQIAPPFFDDLAQRLVWPVRDRAGNWLALTLDHQEPMPVAIEALEATIRSGWQGLALVRVERSGDKLALRPLTLFGGEDPVDLSLWSPPRRLVAKQPLVRDWLARLRSGAGRRFAPMPSSSTEAALATAWRHLLDRAELGPSLARTIDGELAGHVCRLEQFGLPHLAELLREGTEGDRLLAAAYAVMLARQQRCSVPLLR